MKLNAEFYRLPLRFDVQRLTEEVNGFSEQEWRDHPQGYEGNTAMVLVSAHGGQNDDMEGPMQVTEKLDRCPYVRQILASFNTVIGRSRLMRLNPKSEVSQHSDIHYYWAHRVRVHIPIITNTAVRFWCNGRDVHMGAGEAWVFDNWRSHKVINPANFTRVHLVFDTVGSAAFWDLVGTGVNPFDPNAKPREARLVPYQPGAAATFPTERYNVPVVMSPGEMDWLMKDLTDDLQVVAGGSEANLRTFAHLVRSLRYEWRSIWSVHGEQPSGWPFYKALLEETLRRAAGVADGLVMASNQLTALSVLHSRLGVALNPKYAGTAAALPSAQASGPMPAPVLQPRSQGLFDRPVFIVSAPRSGSTLLFETLANNRALWTVGGESHELIEGIQGLSPAANQFHSNRLTAADATPEATNALRANFASHLQDADGKRLQGQNGVAVRFLEKTPKNALRIPLLKAVFPDARFIFLHREPRANVSSIMEAWRSGKFVTYPQLPGWSGPLRWSMLLIPGWRELNGKPLEEVAARQWQLANQQILDDLADLPVSEWCSLRYEDLLNDPRGQIQRLCSFAEIPFGPRMEEVTSKTLSNSRYTLTPPDADKWRKNEAEIERVLPTVAALAEQLRNLTAA
ncbi:MAG TPA: sulfotransferase [Gammaproteobacteria bacterium]|nr:sulfotransferase [Gammaproteobacteria bacterium]